MSPNQWTEVDRYINNLLVPADPSLEAALEASSKAGLPAINVTPNQGKLLQLLAQVQGARSILEIGTLGGYSTIWLARALPKGGRLITLEAEQKHAQVARANIARRPRRHCRPTPRESAGNAAKARQRRPWTIRPHLHRRRQGRLPRLLHMGSQAFPPW